MAFSESAFRPAATLSPFFSPSASEGGSTTGPLSPMSRAYRPFVKGEVMRTLISSAPADSPKMVTFRGSPPNRAMFCSTHFSAAT